MIRLLSLVGLLAFFAPGDWIEDAWRDLRFVLRSLAKTPGFAATAIIVLTVANSA